MRLLVTSGLEEDSVGFNFADGYGIGPHDRCLFHVLVFTGVANPNRGCSFLGNSHKVKRQTQKIKGKSQTDILVGTNIFFVNCDIIEHHYRAGVKARHLFSVSLIHKDAYQTVTY